jgi:hypothetical protein
LAYETAVIISPIDEEKEIAKRRLDELNQRYSPRKTTSNSLTLVRLTAGPPILYGLLLFVHSGMNPSRLPWSSYLGGLVVLLGTLLGTAVRHTAKQAFWQKLPPFITQNRTVLALVGFLIALIPFILLIMNSMNRLAVYRALLP